MLFLSFLYVSKAEIGLTSGEESILTEIIVYVHGLSFLAELRIFASTAWVFSHSQQNIFLPDSTITVKFSSLDELLAL